ncbi:MAG: peptide-methionine (S)-S-oxide reductase MsrA [Pseudomonadota bacterium]|nr:peptide-methionine (S)-S-oxide reductase MsrA [Pseudomonadota bacterium]
MRHLFKTQALPEPGDALPGRSTPLPVPERHAVTGGPLAPPFPEGARTARFALGCFWGAERCFWTLPGVLSTAVGYAGGHTPNPTYEEVCSGWTAHTEMVLVVYDPDALGYPVLLQRFWESHDPTQGMRQGNDLGTQYRSMIQWERPEEQRLALDSRERYQAALSVAGHGEITTEIVPATPFYYAEAYHQQYLAKNPGGYCGLGGTGVGCPTGTLA